MLDLDLLNGPRMDKVDTSAGKDAVGVAREIFTPGGALVDNCTAGAAEGTHEISAAALVSRNVGATETTSMVGKPS